MEFVYTGFVWVGYVYTDIPHLTTEFRSSDSVVNQIIGKHEAAPYWYFRHSVLVVDCVNYLWILFLWHLLVYL